MKNLEREWWYIVLVGGLTVFLHTELLMAAKFDWSTANIYQFAVGYLCLVVIWDIISALLKGVLSAAADFLANKSSEH